MKKILFIGLMLVALFACESKQGTIIGTAQAVTDGGTVVSGITVNLYTQDADLFKTTTTDSEGNFTFNDLESENYFIGATLAVGGDTYDTGNTPLVVYVNDKIVKEIALTLNKK